MPLTSRGPKTATFVNGMVRPCPRRTSDRMLGRAPKNAHTMPRRLESAISMISIDIEDRTSRVIRGHMHPPVHRRPCTPRVRCDR
jgi:hypothetical protein